MSSTSVATQLAAQLKKEIRGDVLFDRFSRGRYATDASVYQMMPHGIVLPRDTNDVQICLQSASEHGVSIVSRGGGTSQCGQTINHSLVIDHSKYLHGILSLDVEKRRCVVEPGLVLDEFCLLYTSDAADE